MQSPIGTIRVVEVFRLRYIRIVSKLSIPVDCTLLLRLKIFIESMNPYLQIFA